jgi:pilus assembly protein CpaC
MITFLLIFSFRVLWANSPDTSDIIVSAKQSFTLPLVKAEQIFVEDGTLLKVIPFAGKYKVITKKSGSSRVYTKSQTWKIHSLKPADYIYYKKLSEVIHGKRGLKISWNDGCSQLSGTLLKLEDLESIRNALMGYQNSSCKNTFRNLIAIDAHLEVKLQEELGEIFKNQNLLLPTYNMKPHLQFFVPEDEMASYQLRLSSYGFIFLGDKQTISTIPNVETEIIVTELRKKQLNQLGIGWPASVDVQLSQKNIEVLPFAWNLQAIEENGFGRVLASPKILSVGGKEAEFLAGGEVPLRAVGYKRNEIIWKSYGILLKVLPFVDAQKRLRLKLSVEVSMLDASQKVDGLPGFLTNRISSEFFIKDNEVLVLSGLIKEHSANSKQGLPGLVNIPILGKLFGSEEYQNNKTELVILVRPTIKPQ